MNVPNSIKGVIIALLVDYVAKKGPILIQIFEGFVANASKELSERWKGRDDQSQKSLTTQLCP